MAVFKYNIIKEVDISNIVNSNERTDYYEIIPTFLHWKTQTDTTNWWTSWITFYNTWKSKHLFWKYNTSNQWMDFRIADTDIGKDYCYVAYNHIDSNTWDEYIHIIKFQYDWKDLYVYRFKLTDNIDSNWLKIMEFQERTDFTNYSSDNLRRWKWFIANWKIVSSYISKKGTDDRRRYLLLYISDISIDSNNKLNIWTPTKKNLYNSWYWSDGWDDYKFNLNNIIVSQSWNIFFLVHFQIHHKSSSYYRDVLKWIMLDNNLTYIDNKTLWSDSSDASYNNKIQRWQEFYHNDKRVKFNWSSLDETTWNDDLWKSKSAIWTYKDNNNCFYTSSDDKLINFDGWDNNYIDYTLNNEKDFSVWFVDFIDDKNYIHYYDNWKYRIMTITNDTNDDTESLISEGWAVWTIAVPNWKTKMKMKLVYDLNWVDESNEDKVELYYKFDNESNYTKIDRDWWDEVIIPTWATSVDWKFVLKLDWDKSPTAYNIQVYFYN